MPEVWHGYKGSLPQLQICPLLVMRPGPTALLSSPPEFQNLANNPKYADDVQRLSEPLLAWHKTLPAGPHAPARGCAGYRFPGSAPLPDGKASRATEEDSDEAAWWG